MSVALSSVVALTLTPALCAVLLKVQHGENKFFAPFNRLFERLTRAYIGVVSLTIKHSIIVGLIFIALIASIIGFFRMVEQEIADLTQAVQDMTALKEDVKRLVERMKKAGEA